MHRQVVHISELDRKREPAHERSSRGLIRTSIREGISSSPVEVSVALHLGITAA